MRNPEMGNPEKQPVLKRIILLAENRSLIESKILDYIKRYRPELPREEQWDIVYKLEIAKKLKDESEVELDELEHELAEEFGAFDKESFTAAARVMKDYATTGGKNTFKVKGDKAGDKGPTSIEIDISDVPKK